MGIYQQLTAFRCNRRSANRRTSRRRTLVLPTESGLSTHLRTPLLTMCRSPLGGSSLGVSAVSARPIANHSHANTRSDTAVRPMPFRQCGRVSRHRALNAKTRSTGTATRLVAEAMSRTIGESIMAVCYCKYQWDFINNQECGNRIIRSQGAFMRTKIKRNLGWIVFSAAYLFAFFSLKHTGLRIRYRWAGLALGGCRDV